MLENAKETDIEILGYMLYKTTEIAKLMKLLNGYRIIINNGKDGGRIKRTNS